MSAEKVPPKYLFDLYGVIGVLESNNNKLRSAFIDGLETGEVKVMHGVSKELKDTYEDLYKEFQSMKSGRVYQKSLPKHFAMQQNLMEKFGTSLWGNSPKPEHFEAIAVCAVEKLHLVTHDKPLKMCSKIVDKCALKKCQVMSLQEFSEA